MSAPRPQGEEHWRHLLASEYARCIALVENCDREQAAARELLTAWEEERRKWAERAISISAALGGDLGEVKMPPPRRQSELTDAWEFDTR